MAFIGLVEMLKTQIGNALREPDFRAAFLAAAPEQRTALVAAHIADKRIEAKIIAVTDGTRDDDHGEYRVEWQPFAGGPNHHQWFSPDRQPRTLNPLMSGLQPTHPRELLREGILPALELSVADAARALDVSPEALSGILDESQPVTPEMAARIGRLTGTTAGSWVAMQEDYDLRIAAARSGQFDAPPKR